MPATAETSTPPASPEVMRQQAGPVLSQYAQKASQQAGPALEPAKQMVQQAFKAIAELMAKIAKVISVEQPELMPILTRMAGAGKALETEYNKASQQAQPGSSAPPAQDPAQAEGQPEAMGI